MSAPVPGACPDDHTREAAELYEQCRREGMRTVPELTPGSVEYQRGPTALAMCSGEAWRYLGRSGELGQPDSGAGQVAG